MQSLQAMVGITCVMSLLTGLVHAMKPNEKMSHQLSLLLSCVFLLAVFTPILHWKDDWSASSFFTAESVDTQAIANAVSDQTIQLAQENVKQVLADALAQQSISWQSIETEVHIQSDNSISISKVTVWSDETEAVQAVLETYFGKEVEQLVYPTAETAQTVAPT